MNDGTVDAEVITRVLESAHAEVEAKRAEAGGALKKELLTFAMSFNKFMGLEFVRELEPVFPGVRCGEIPSAAERGQKRVDVFYGAIDSGLQLMISFKSVHQGEKGGNAGFTHNRKRNDEELRVEATEHHVRQPYAVLVAVIFLPFESCRDAFGPKGRATSSFASWVKYLWPLQDRDTPSGRPDCFELVFIALYERDRSAFGFYEVRGDVPCPRQGVPGTLMSFADFVARVRAVHERRNSTDFRFADEK